MYKPEESRGGRLWWIGPLAAAGIAAWLRWQRADFFAPADFSVQLLFQGLCPAAPFGIDRAAFAGWLGIAFSSLAVFPVFAAAARICGRPAATLSALLCATLSSAIHLAGQSPDAGLLELSFALLLWLTAIIRDPLSPARSIRTFGPAVALLLLTAYGIYSCRNSRGLDMMSELDMYAAALVAVLAAFGILSHSPRQNLLLFPLALLNVDMALVGLCIFAGIGAWQSPSLVRARLAPARRQAGFRAAAAASALLAAAIIGLGIHSSYAAPSMKKPATPDQQALMSVREAAVEAAARVQLDCGLRVCADHPAWWHFLRADGRPLPTDIAAAEAALADGSCQFLALDSHFLRRENPALKSLLTAAAIKGGKLVYRRYLIDSNTLVSIYRSDTLPGGGIRVPWPMDERGRPVGAPIEIYTFTRELGKTGYVEEERRLLQGLLSVMNLPDAHRDLMKIYLIYGRFDGSSFEAAEEELRRYSFMAGDDPLLPVYRKSLSELRLRHQAEWGR